MDYMTKNEYIYEKLKDEIVDGKLASGERIIIREVSKKFGVSGVPIREALNRLQQDGLVEIIPHVGAKVVEFDLKKFKEIMSVRVELEIMATKLATPNISEDTFKQLEELQQQMKQCVEDGDGYTYSKINKKLHLLIYSSCPNQFLYELIESLWERSEYSRSVFFMYTKRLPDSYKEHDEWLSALRAKDADKAGEILRQQKKAALSILYVLLEKDINA